MWIEREIRNSVALSARQFPVVVVTGPRQVGKTSLLQHDFAKHGYVSLDLPATAEMAETRPEAFLEAHPPPLLIDEVQYAPRLFRHLKARVDSSPGQRGQFLLTGSQTFALMEHISESLAGRAAVFAMLGLSGNEWAQAASPADARAWRDFLWRGSYPGLWSSAEPPDRDRWYQSYLATYLERDVRAAIRASSLRDFDRFLRACAARTGQLLNMSDLGRDVGISATTARDWLSVLQASNQVTLLEPYHRSLGRRLVKSPKLYLTDTGLAAFLLGFASPASLWASAAAGALWETYVVGQWVRWRDWHAPAASLWFWQDRNGHEVDLLVDYDGRLHPIECKLHESPTPLDRRGLTALRALYGEEAVAAPSLASPTLATYAQQDTTVRPGWRTWALGD